MHFNTPAIVLHSTKYSDSAVILTVYTSELGRASYFVRNSSKKKSSFRNALLQPLTILNINALHQNGKTIHQLKEIQTKHPFSSIPFNPIKNALALFIAEILYKALRHEEADEQLYYFLENSILELDGATIDVANFHLVFLVKFSRYLGFEPSTNDSKYNYFDLINGIFVATPPQHGNYLGGETCSDFSALLGLNYDAMSELVLTRKRRSILLEKLLDFYQFHLEDFRGLQSMTILKSLFD